MNDTINPAQPRQILIVDDEQLNLVLLEAILNNEGYDTRTASNGMEAVQFVFENPPDLVVMDVCMPEKDGFEACREIKASLNDNFVPVILLTNLTDTNSKVQGLDAGADEYLTKPPAKEELLARVRAMLRIRDLQANLQKSKQELQQINQKLVQAQKHIEEDLERVSAIQHSFLPNRFPFHPEIEFGRYYVPCATAGGDYFDVIEIGKNLWGLLIADVTGHGTPAAVVMAITHTLMHSFVNSFRYPSTALKVANEKLNAHLAPTFYVTMFYGILNLDAMKFRFSSAGHEPMMLYKASQNKVDYLKTAHGFPLKLLESDDYDENEVPIEPNDKIILFTDGLVEIRDDDGNLFSPERLKELVLKYHHLRPQPFVDAIISEVKEFNSQETFKDDLTLFVIQRIT